MLLKWIVSPAWRPQARISRSWIELNWSASGCVSCNQNHWATDASSNAVGVSALYSSSFGGVIPSQARSNRP